MQTRQHNQFGPGPEDAAPVPRVGLTAAKAYTTKADTKQIQTCGQKRNNEENFRGQPQLLLVLRVSLLVTNFGHTTPETHFGEETAASVRCKAGGPESGPESGPRIRSSKSRLLVAPPAGPERTCRAVSDGPVTR